MRVLLATLLFVPASTLAQTFVDYSATPTNATTSPVSGSRWWHSDVNTTSAGQNRNVAFRTDPTVRAEGSNVNRSRVVDQTLLATTAPGALVGNLSTGNAYELDFAFSAPGVANGTQITGVATDTTLRVFANPGNNGAPVIDTTKLVTVDVWTLNPMRFAFALAEGATGAQVDRDYTTAGVFKTSTGSIEYAGGTGTNALNASGAPGGFLLSAGWNTITLDFATASLRGLTGNGVLNPIYANRVAINGFFLSPTTSSYTAGRQQIVLDNWRQSPVPEPASMAVLGLGLAALKRRRKNG